ncbi:hypothetical protein LWI28_020563 [Acer negundo]|uniref:Uncharacterized protein n=1 Tax=Acer negundo TaxID=4023 RepID=A0AAD5J5C6_ACENE|nr:hypothetical protein LWI28_020563 [Acer negundo]
MWKHSVNDIGTNNGEHCEVTAVETKSCNDKVLTSAIQAWTPKPTLCSSISQHHPLSKSFDFSQTDHHFRCRLAVVSSDSKSSTLIANSSHSGKDEIQIDFGGDGGGGCENFGGGGGDDQNDRGERDQEEAEAAK